MERDLRNVHIQLLEKIPLELRGNMQSLTCILMEASYILIITLLIHTDEDIGNLFCCGFSEKSIITLILDQLRQTFDNLQQAHMIGRNHLGSTPLEETSAILWDNLQNHVAMAELSKHMIKHHNSITSVFIQFFIITMIYDPL